MKGQKPVELLTATVCVLLLNRLSGGGGGGGAGKVMQPSLFSRKRGDGFQRLHAGYSAHSSRPFTGEPESGGMLIKDATVKPAHRTVQRSSLKARGCFLPLSVCCAEAAEDPLWSAFVEASHSLLRGTEHTEATPRTRRPTHSEEVLLLYPPPTPPEAVATVQLLLC